MKITRVDITPFEAGFKGGSYVMSYVTQTRLHTRIIRLTTDTGEIGLGEIVRRPSFDRAECEALEDARLAKLKGRSVSDILSLTQDWFTEGKLVRGLIFGVETACLDLIARRADQTLHEYLGGACMDKVPLYHSISAGDPDAMAASARANPNAPVLQPKLGVDTVAQDKARLRAVLDAAQPDQRVLSDFNGAFDLETAKELLDIEDPRLMWEDPCLSYDDICAFAEQTKTPVMADMCMSEPEDYARACDDHIVSAVVIKPQFTGGLRHALDAMRTCERRAMTYRIDGPWSGPIAASAVLHLAKLAHPDLLYCSADLTQGLDQKFPEIQYQYGHAAPPAGPGLGEVIA